MTLSRRSSQNAGRARSSSAFRTMRGMVTVSGSPAHSRFEAFRRLALATRLLAFRPAVRKPCRQTLWTLAPSSRNAKPEFAIQTMASDRNSRVHRLVEKLVTRCGARDPIAVGDPSDACSPRDRRSMDTRANDLSRADRAGRSPRKKVSPTRPAGRSLPRRSTVDGCFAALPHVDEEVADRIDVLV